MRAGDKRPVAASEAEGVHHVRARRYLTVWVVLVAFTFLTFALSRLALGEWSLAIAIAIAFTKSTLVALYFMHLHEHQGTNRLVLAVATLFVGLLLAFSVADVMTRFPLAVPSDPSHAAAARDDVGKVLAR